jgi:hypothetical protein
MIDNFNIYLITQLKKKPRVGRQADQDPSKLTRAYSDLTAAGKAFWDAYNTAGGTAVQQNIFGILGNQAQTLVKNLSTLETLNLKVRDSFNVNASSAAKLGVTIEQLALKQKQNTQTAKEYVGELENIFAGQTKYINVGGKFANQLVNQNGLIRDQLKVSSAAYENYVRYQATIGGKTKNTDQLAANMSKVNDGFANVAASTKDFYSGGLTKIISGFENLSAETSAMYGKDQKNLGLAMLKADALGINLNEAAKAGEGFLNIEESITAELAATIVSGEELTATIKDANGEREVSIAQAMREAVLNKDLNQQMDLRSQLAEKYGEKIKEDLFARKEIAGLMGISEESLVKMVTQYEAAANVNKKIFQTNIDDLNVTDAKLATMVELESKQTAIEESLKNQTQQQSKVMGNYAPNAPAERKAAIEAGDKINKGSTESGALTESTIVKIGVGVKAAFDALTGVGSALQSGLAPGSSPVKDVFIPAGGSNIITGNYGSFTTAPGDDILAAPNIRQATSAGGSDTAAIISALQGMTFHVTNTFDGDKIQSSLSIRQGQTLNNINQV